MNKYIISSIILSGLMIFFAGYASKCHGEECDIKTNIKMTPKEIQQKVENKEIVLLDVREVYEWQEGHIDGAINLPLGEINEETSKNLHKNIPIYIYCRSGNRAGQAESILKNLGFNNLKNIGGIIEWQQMGGELVK